MSFLKTFISFQVAQFLLLSQWLAKIKVTKLKFLLLNPLKTTTGWKKVESSKNAFKRIVIAQAKSF